MVLFEKSGDGDIFEDDLQGNSDEMDEDDEALMAAFAGLDALGSLDGPTKDISIDESNALDDMIKDLNDISSVDQSAEPKKDKSAEEEIKLYAEMLGELSDKGEEGIYDDLRLDLTASGYSGLQDLLENIEDDDNDEDERIPDPTQEVDLVAEIASEDLFDRVMNEALQEAKAKSPDIEIADVDADAEMMAEINALFDKAAQEMKQAAAVIKKDQDILSQEYSKLRAEKIREEEERIRQGEEQVQKMVKKVEKEANEVQIAMKELEAAKAAADKLNQDPIMKALNFKETGIVKQGAFALALLCGVRALGDLIQIGGVAGNEHAFLAGVQAIIAAVAAVYYFFF